MGRGSVAVRGWAGTRVRSPGLFGVVHLLAPPRVLTNRTEPSDHVDAEHRQHAQVELVIRDLKVQALAHFPSGHYSANSAWTVIACLAHNLARWTALLGLSDPTPRAARTLRRRLFALPGRLTRTARRWTLQLPIRWPWQTDFIEALTRIRALPAA